LICKDKAHNKSGVVLIIVLWILVILSVLAIGLGRKSRVELALIKHSIGKFKAKALAKAGIMVALDHIQRDTRDEQTKAMDTLYQCGVTLSDGKSMEEVFINIPLGEGFFEISYEQDNQAGEQGTVLPGFIDEERKININAVSSKDYLIIAHLARLLGIEDETAETIAASIVDWHDADSKQTNAPFGAEDDDYQSLTKPYHCKNQAFDRLEELLLVQGVTLEVFAQLKDFLTVFPKDSKTLLVNFNTASRVVIQAMARSFTGGKTNADEIDADSLADKMIMYRAGEDGEEMTEDDRLLNRNEMGLNAKEQVVFLAMQKNLTNVSNYFTVAVKGVDQSSGISARIQAIVSREKLSIVQWERK